MGLNISVLVQAPILIKREEDGGTSKILINILSAA